MSNNMPRVSIGLPVYNGERFLPIAIESILNQTYSDFELIICDNASTDSTPAICEEYAARDARIRYFANPRNMGAAFNYDRVLDLSRGEYFKWTAHDDVIAPDFLEKCVELLDRDPSVVGAAGKSLLIDANSKVVKPEYEASMDSARPSERYLQQLTDIHGFRQIFGLYRAQIVRNCGPNGRWGSSDKNVLARLALQGRILVVNAILYSRCHPMQSVNTHTSTHARSVWFDPSLAGRIQFPRWLAVYDYFAAIFAYPMPLGERARCVGIWLEHMHWRGLAKDVLVAGLTIVRRLTGGGWEPDKILDPAAKRRDGQMAEKLSRTL